MNDFILINKINVLNEYVQCYVYSNFPKNHLILKIKLEENMYNLFENTVRANMNKGNIRNKYQKEILINECLLEHYFRAVFDKKIIVKKRYKAIINMLLEIKKIIYGWIGSEEKEQFV